MPNKSYKQSLGPAAMRNSVFFHALYARAQSQVGKRCQRRSCWLSCASNTPRGVANHNRYECVCVWVWDVCVCDSRVAQKLSRYSGIGSVASVLRCAIASSSSSLRTNKREEESTHAVCLCFVIMWVFFAMPQVRVKVTYSHAKHTHTHKHHLTWLDYVNMYI